MDTPDLKPILEHIIDAAPPENQGGVEVQVTLMNGANMSGALYRNTFGVPDVYVLRTLVRKGDPRPGVGETAMVDVFFASKAVFSIMAATPQSAVPRIITPHGGLVPRMQ
jgi:hypothetical protein